MKTPKINPVSQYLPTLLSDSEKQVGVILKDIFFGTGRASYQTIERLQLFLFAMSYSDEAYDKEFRGKIELCRRILADYTKTIEKRVNQAELEKLKASTADIAEQYEALRHLTKKADRRKAKTP